MLIRRRTLTFTFLLASGLLAPVTGHADTSAPTTLYVNDTSGSNCSDAGTGTSAQPYCTIQAAVAVVNAGQTVYIEPGSYYGSINITRSGTAAAPITITAPAPVGNFYKVYVSANQSATSTMIAFSDVQYVDLSNIAVTGSVGDEFQISGGSNITLDRVGALGAGDLNQPHPPVAGIHVTGGSSDVRVQRAQVTSTYGSGIEVDGASTGTMLSTDMVRASLSNDGFIGINVSDAPQTTITSNTVNANCTQALVVDNGSTGAVIENNVLVDRSVQSPCATNTLTLDASATPSAVADYNDLYNSDGGFEYNWGGTDYATAAAFMATGQGAHDQDYPSPGNVFSGPDVATLIDAANSAAPGELATDQLGKPRVDDPFVSNTGVGPYSYYDRGALETQEPLSVSFSSSATRAPVGGNVKFSAAATDAWATSYTYAFDFGDGTKISDSTGVEEHTYTATGTYTATVTVTSSYGGTMTTSSKLVVDEPAPLVPGLAGAFQSIAGYLPRTLKVDWLDNTTGGWNPVSAVIDYGDCSAPFTTSGLNLQANDIHEYAVPGVYTVTLTVTDAGGNTASMSTTYGTPDATSFTSCGKKKILLTPNAAGGTPPGVTLSAMSGGLVGSGRDSVKSNSVGGGSQGMGSFSGGGVLGASAGV